MSVATSITPQNAVDMLNTIAKEDPALFEYLVGCKGGVNAESDLNANESLLFGVNNSGAKTLSMLGVLNGMFGKFDAEDDGPEGYGPIEVVYNYTAVSPKPVGCRLLGAADKTLYEDLGA